MRIHSIDFKSVKLVVECADRGTLGAAALQCHCTVSAASRRLIILEGLLGCRLFERSGKGLKITNKGLTVVALCRDILCSLNKIVT
jgi:DNA-binding transcriptional LysR family regulator